MEERIALISPRASTGKNMIRRVQPPLGLLSLAAVLDERGYRNVEIFDALIEDYENVQPHADFQDDLITFGAGNENIIQWLKKFQPDLIGVSSLFSSQVSQAFSFCQAAKTSFPDVPIVLGGIHASDKCVEVMRTESSIDYIVTGEADYTFADFVSRYFIDRKVEEIDGVVWREGSKVRRNMRPAFILDMDKLPFPAWEKIANGEIF